MSQGCPHLVLTRLVWKIFKTRK